MYRVFQLILIIWIMGASFSWATENLDAIEVLYDTLVIGESVEVAGEPVMATGIVSLFYESRNFEPAWSDLDYASSIIELLGKSSEEGLRPEDYHYSALRSILENLQSFDKNSSRQQSDLDILLTDGVLLYASHLVNGKIDPSRFEKTWNYRDVEIIPEKVVYSLNTHVDNKTVAQGLEQLKPEVKVYKQMKEELAFFSDLAAQEKFVKINPGQTLRVGDINPAVAELRNRLAALQFLSSGHGSDEYDDVLHQAVKKFQAKFHLDADGIVGPATLAALNVSFVERADQIRINMERIRWVINDISSDFLIVNIAGFKLWLVQNSDVKWETDVMTGTIRTKTPVFKSRMTYLVFNPTWTAPRSITREMFPRFKKDPNYLQRNNYRLIDRNGQEADPSSLDWNSLSRRNFPYTLVQMPGQNNALGQVKFMFPNKHSIYLHDTPSKHLFKKTRRDFSHGCIRVKDPFVFAELLLDDSKKWNQEKIAEVIQGGKTTNVKLQSPVDVLIMYWTVQPGADGKLDFLSDIYQRDNELIAALKKPLF